MINCDTIYFLVKLEELKERSKNGILPRSKMTKENYKTYLFYEDDKDSDRYKSVIVDICPYGRCFFSCEFFEDDFDDYLNVFDEDEDKQHQVESNVLFDNNNQLYARIYVTDPKDYSSYVIFIQDGKIEI